MNLSNVKQLNKVPFPKFNYERAYMVKFFKQNGLPKELFYWQDTVDAMLNGIETKYPIYIMIDQGCVKAGSQLRRPGLHIDGYWDGVKHNDHKFNNVEDQAIILSSNITGCKAYIGEYKENSLKGGNCSHIDTTNLEKIDMVANYAYIGDTNAMLHETISMSENCYRTVVRLNVSGIKFKSL